MSKQSEQFRDQARRAERLALTVSDNQACAKLKELSTQFSKDAERLERAILPASSKALSVLND